MAYSETPEVQERWPKSIDTLPHEAELYIGLDLEKREEKIRCVEGIHSFILIN